MKNRFILAALFAALAFPALAADNWTAQTPSGAVTFRSKDTGSGIESPQVTLQDANNAVVVTCNNHVFKHITTATDTLAVQGVTSQSVYVCAWRSRAAGVATWFLENT